MDVNKCESCHLTWPRRRDRYLSWDMKGLLALFQQNPEIAAKVKALWATRLSNRLENLRSDKKTPSLSPDFNLEEC